MYKKKVIVCECGFENDINIAQESAINLCKNCGLLSRIKQGEIIPLTGKELQTFAIRLKKEAPSDYKKIKDVIATYYLTEINKQFII